MCEFELVKRGNEESRGHCHYKSQVVHVSRVYHVVNVSGSGIIDSRP